MDYISHPGMTLILFDRSTIQPVCLFDVYLFAGLKPPLFKKCFSDLNLYKAVVSSSFIVQLKLKCLLMKPTHDDIIEAKEA